MRFRGSGARAPGVNEVFGLKIPSNVAGFWSKKEAKKERFGGEKVLFFRHFGTFSPRAALRGYIRDFRSIRWENPSNDLKLTLQRARKPSRGVI